MLPASYRGQLWVTVSRKLAGLDDRLWRMCCRTAYFRNVPEAANLGTRSEWIVTRRHESASGKSRSFAREQPRLGCPRDLCLLPSFDEKRQKRRGLGWRV